MISVKQAIYPTVVLGTLFLFGKCNWRILKSRKSKMRSRLEILDP